MKALFPPTLKMSRSSKQGGRQVVYGWSHSVEEVGSYETVGYKHESQSRKVLYHNATDAS